MKAIVRRGERGRHNTKVVRDDGVSFDIPAYGPAAPMPHDLAHFVIENALGMTDGLWGTIADGGILPGMTKIAGREKPHAGRHAETVVKANRRSLVIAEVLVEILVHTLQDYGTGDAVSAHAELRERTGRALCLPVDLSPLYRDLDAMRLRWRSLPEDGRIELDWYTSHKRRRKSH